MTFGVLGVFGGAGTRGFAGNMKRRVGRDTKEKNHPTAVEVIVYH